MNAITDTTTARAWVGCLGCYNGGTLNGVWLDGTEATSYGEHLKTYERDGVTFCSLCHSDEFWLFDHENYGGLISGECSPNEAQEKAELLDNVPEEWREIFMAWIANGMNPDFDDCQDNYIGEFASDLFMAEDFIESTGMLADMPENLQRYFDYEKYARDLMYDAFESNGHYFWNR